ncbi:bifunctional 2-keto-4-hydroxyglutarate aldolase/2-keto-3-deoxy-6-phosphogluconate aldolase [Oceanivirga salmonicida]|uniref:bifunctional 2-keto-4-hydroxyglutarate aldolase/2-keto-3-deoxy-6-phosphogluconate aldolase n=1 Tax=Oceanivirga salmonicida TaxID=1769291 RepID=UPI0012E31D62|nr:bifunctional 2-keto-4-hydroxyglutarate aldolase/2-keto-3-deoxy-6-phosphogluconate aldolase [Oceanivirga salmonicida]
MKQTILSKINKDKLIAVIRGNDEIEAYEISKKVIEGGIKIIEVAFSTPSADKTIEMLSKEYVNDKNILIGAGTVLDDITARIAILRGAKFIVSPNFNKDISILCNRYSIPYLPGCLTVNEIVNALESGVEVIKLFPGDLGGIKFMKNMKGPLPNVKIMPSGGVSIDNMKDWLSNGAYAVGIGSALTKNIKELGYDSIKIETSKFVEKLNEILNV